MDEAWRIVRGDFGDPRVIALLRVHLESARAATGPKSAHALDLSGLQSPAISFWTIWRDDLLAGMGALKKLSPREGEVKSMHTAAAARRGGAAAAMLRHIIGAARAAGLSRLYLETGSWDYFIPAHALYRSHGFVDCPPFGEYRPDPNSVFMTLGLDAGSLPAASG